MKREKKINIRHYLNTRLKPTIFQGEKHYPVYTQVTYDRRNTQFHSLFSLTLSYGITKEDFKEAFEDKKHGFLNEEIIEYDNLIKEIVRFESKALKDRFTLKGFSYRLDFYKGELLKELEQYCILKLNDFVRSNINETKLEAFDLITSMDNFSFFVDVYSMAENLVSDLREKLPKSLELAFTCYLHLTTSNILPTDKQYLKVKDWFDSEIRRKFQEYVLKYKHDIILKSDADKSIFYKIEEQKVLAGIYKELFKNESPKSLFVKVWCKFPLFKNNIINYQSMVTQMILEMSGAIEDAKNG